MITSTVPALAVPTTIDLVFDKSTEGTTQTVEVNTTGTGVNETSSTIKSSKQNTVPVQNNDPKSKEDEFITFYSSWDDYRPESETKFIGYYWIVYDMDDNNRTVRTEFMTHGLFKHTFTDKGTFKVERYSVYLRWDWSAVYRMTPKLKWNWSVGGSLGLSNSPDLVVFDGWEATFVENVYNSKSQVNPTGKTLTASNGAILATIDGNKGMTIESSGNINRIVYPTINTYKREWPVVIRKRHTTWDENTPQQNTAPDVDGNLAG